MSEITSDEDLKALLLAAAEHDLFEDCFSLPGFARARRLGEIATDYAGVPVAAADLLSGGRFDVDGFSGRFFEALFLRHQMPWNGGPVR